MLFTVLGSFLLYSESKKVCDLLFIETELFQAEVAFAGTHRKPNQHGGKMAAWHRLSAVGGAPCANREYISLSPKYVHTKQTNNN